MCLLNFMGRMTAVSVTASTPSPNTGAVRGKYCICVCTAPQLRKWLWSRWMVLIMQWLATTHGGCGSCFWSMGTALVQISEHPDGFKNIQVYNIPDFWSSCSEVLERCKNQKL